MSTDWFAVQVHIENTKMGLLKRLNEAPLKVQDLAPTELSALEELHGQGKVLIDWTEGTAHRVLLG